MKLTPKQYAEALYDTLRETNDHDKVLDNFVKILAQNGDLGKHAEIEKEYQLLDKQAHGIKEVGVTTAKTMEVNSTLMNELNEIIGGKIEIKKQVDEGLIGGVIVRVDDTLIDASVKTQLKKLNHELKS